MSEHLKEKKTTQNSGLRTLILRMHAFCCLEQEMQSLGGFYTRFFEQSQLQNIQKMLMGKDFTL